MVSDTFKWMGDSGGYLELIDQRQLPAKVVKIRCEGINEVWRAIRDMTIRGAPAIGVFAGYGVVLGLREATVGLKDGLAVVAESCEYLGTARPTAINLFWALERIKRKAEDFASSKPAAGLDELREVVLSEAHAIFTEDVAMCRRIGENGERFIGEGAGVLTHCNAGGLATAGEGTALSVMFEAHRRGRRFKVYADETRPLLQGARLTAWELEQAGIEVVVICDNMAGWLMKQGKIDLVVTGADRIAANGDVANKIGTYGLSVLAKEHNVPFYVAAPSSSFDLSIATGTQIPIEERSADELKFFGRVQVAPDGAGFYNPAFDVTATENITAIITELGVIEVPSSEKIAEHLSSGSRG